MRCLSCDTTLTNRETSRKYASGKYIDLCNKCFSYIEQDIEVEVNPENVDDYSYDDDSVEEDDCEIGRLFD